MKKYDENNTANQIMNMAFRLFVEKGYEAANLREIGNSVGISASTIYFYYKSKKDLFLDVLNQALEEHLEELSNCATKIVNDADEDKLKELFVAEIEMIHLDSASYLFLLRYRMFPVSELSSEIMEVSKLYVEKEFQIWRPFLVPYCDGTDENERQLFKSIMRMINGIINEMLTSGEAINRQALNKLWMYCYNYIFDKS